MAKPPAKVPVKSGDTLSAIAKANDTTVAKILADPRNATIAARVEAGTTPIFSGSSVAIPPKTATKPAAAAPTSGVVPNFIPYITPGNPTNGQFIGPIPTGTTRTATGYETTPTNTAPTGWVKAGTVDTINGPVDVDSTGRAKDGSIPIAKTSDSDEGFTTNGNQALYKGVPFNGVRNGITFINGYRQDKYNPDGTDRTVQKTKEDYDKEQLALAEQERLANQRKDAFAEIEATIKSYGFNETELKEINAYLASTLINPKIGPQQALLDMRELGAYKTRFAGNELRFKNGFNRISEADYLQQEDDYGAKLTEYGVGSLGNRAQFATLIGNRVSVTEVGKRAALAVDRVKNADPAIMTTLKRFYTGITDTDLVAYFLNPTQQLPELERKVLTGEIGAAAKEYGLNDLSLARAQEFAALGVDQAGARRGYQQIADKLPRGAQLSAIAPEDQIVYNQALAEDATIKGLASAKRAEENIKNKEIARFLGSSGAAQGAFSTSYLKKSSAAGQI